MPPLKVAAHSAAVQRIGFSALELAPTFFFPRWIIVRGLLEVMLSGRQL